MPPKGTTTVGTTASPKANGAATGGLASAMQLSFLRWSPGPVDRCGGRKRPRCPPRSLPHRRGRLASRLVNPRSFGQVTWSSSAPARSAQGGSGPLDNSPRNSLPLSRATGKHLSSFPRPGTEKRVRRAPGVSPGWVAPFYGHGDVGSAATKFCVRHRGLTPPARRAVPLLRQKQCGNHRMALLAFRQAVAHRAR